MNSSTPSARHAARLVLVLAALCALAVPGTAAARARAAAALLAGPAPIPLNTANWSGAAGFGSRVPAWYTDLSGIVHLQGAVKQTSRSGGEANQIGLLPKAARPAHIVVTIVHSFAGTYEILAIDPTGVISVSGPPEPAVQDFTFVSLEGITYRRTGLGSAIALNTANYSESGGPFRRAAWYTDDSGVVHLQGAVAQISGSGSGADLIGTLPPAARPAHDVFTIVTTTGGYADLGITPSGQLDLIDPRPPAIKDYSFVSLESISYRPRGATSALAVNTANWSGKAGFGSRGPAWYTDKSGIVHLQGAVTQTNGSGSGPNLIGTLPPAARPRHNMFAIVHTFAGTYADLSIGTNGQIDVLSPRPPMVTDYTFVSLESITYRR